MDEKDLKGTGGSGEQNKKEYEDVCFICRRPESKAGRMFHLPNNIRLHAQDDGCGKPV